MPHHLAENLSTSLFREFQRLQHHRCRALAQHFARSMEIKGATCFTCITLTRGNLLLQHHVECPELVYACPSRSCEDLVGPTPLNGRDRLTDGKIA